MPPRAAVRRRPMGLADPRFRVAEDPEGFEPGLELRRRPQAQHRAHIERVMKAGRLIAEHDVVGAGDAHDVVAARRRRAVSGDVHVVLIGLGMIGVADVNTHRQAEQLAAEMIFEPGADDLLAVVRYSGPMKPTTVLTSSGWKRARDRIGARFQVCWSTP